jgi:hypothetical protein
MPITRQQFRSRVDEDVLTVMTDIHSFLARHGDMAYTEHEIRAQALGISVGMLDEPPVTARSLRISLGSARPKRQIVGAALEKLVEVGAIEAKVIDGSLYFAYRQDLPSQLSAA